MSDETRGEQLVRTIHAWCPACGGTGMVMTYGGPDDCPNADAHSYLAQIQGQSA